MTKTLKINEFVSVDYVANGRFDRQMKKEAKRQEAIHKEQEILQELWEWLQTADPTDINYSDIYKEVYGHRPRC